MNVCVFNGSPKGKYSVTLQTVLYIQSMNPDCAFEVLDVGQKIKSYEKDMSQALQAISRADLLVFSYPVYTFIAPYQLHRFIELLKENGACARGKCAVQITTSKHFYDVTAHGYIRENCLDMGMCYLGGFSADMDDILTEKGRAQASAFWKYALFCARNRLFELREESPTARRAPYTRALEETAKTDAFDTVIVTNLRGEDASLCAMIEDFRAVYPFKTRVINIAEYPFSGGCLGCFHCAGDGKCVYKDGFDTFLREKIQTANAIVYAFTIKDHSMGASFKLYDDRQFANGHRTVTMGMPMGYIVNGDLAREANLRAIIEARCEVGGNFLSGMATDAAGIRALSAKLTYALQNKLALPPNFLGVGGMKIFRDLIYLMRGLMKEDHRFYKKHGLYDFPQKKSGMILKIKLVGLLATNPKLKSKLGNRMNEGMLAPYRKALEKAKQNAK